MKEHQMDAMVRGHVYISVVFGNDDMNTNMNL